MLPFVLVLSAMEELPTFVGVLGRQGLARGEPDLIEGFLLKGHARLETTENRGYFGRVFIRLGCKVLPQRFFQFRLDDFEFIVGHF